MAALTTRMMLREAFLRRYRFEFAPRCGPSELISLNGEREEHTVPPKCDTVGHPDP